MYEAVIAEHLERVRVGCTHAHIGLTVRALHARRLPVTVSLRILEYVLSPPLRGTLTREYLCSCLSEVLVPLSFFQPGTICAGCHRAGGLLRCVKCKCVKYCSAACQKAHWKRGGHKQSCGKSSAAQGDKTDHAEIPKGRLSLLSYRLALSVTPTKPLRADTNTKQLKAALRNLPALVESSADFDVKLLGAEAPATDTDTALGEPTDRQGCVWLLGYVSLLSTAYKAQLDEDGAGAEGG